MNFDNQLPIASLSDEQILELSSAQMPEHEQSELSDLLGLNRENKLSPDERKRLDELMAIYGQGMVCKAEALKEAVQRGLIPPLS